jgi:hypothetical protein
MPRTPNFAQRAKTQRGLVQRGGRITPDWSNATNALGPAARCASQADHVGPSGDYRRGAGAPQTLDARRAQPRLERSTTRPQVPTAADAMADSYTYLGRTRAPVIRPPQP